MKIPKAFAQRSRTGGAVAVLFPAARSVPQRPGALPDASMRGAREFPPREAAASWTEPPHAAPDRRCYH